MDSRFRSELHPRDLRGEFRRSEMALHIASRVMAGGGNLRPDLADSPGRSRHGRLRNYAAMTDAKLIGVLTGLTQYGKDPEAVGAAQAEAARRTGKKIKETTMTAMDRRTERRLEEFGLHLSTPHIGGDMFKEQLHPRSHGKFTKSFRAPDPPAVHDQSGHYTVSDHSRWIESNDKSDKGIEELHAHARAMDREHGTTHEFHDPRKTGQKHGASVKFHGTRAQMNAVAHATRMHYLNSNHSPQIFDAEKDHKAQEAALKAVARQRLAKRAVAFPEIEAEMIAEIAEAADSMLKATTPQPFSTSKTSNWVARGGGLPDYIQHVAHGLVRSGHSTSEAIGMAIGIVRRWARGGGKIDKNTQAAATLAIGEWEKLKSANAAKKAA